MKCLSLTTLTASTALCFGAGSAEAGDVFPPGSVPDLARSRIIDSPIEHAFVQQYGLQPGQRFGRFDARDNAKYDARRRSFAYRYGGGYGGGANPGYVNPGYNAYRPAGFGYGNYNRGYTPAGYGYGNRGFGVRDFSSGNFQYGGGYGAGYGHYGYAPRGF